MKFIFPDYATKCMSTIEKAGFEAWFVGGCVRDSFIGRRFSDVDITTSALPEEIISLFAKTVPTGIKHGTVTVVIDKKPIEVTTYRSEFGYDDSRHPNSVKFEKNLSADLSRRDFTINAMAYNPQKGVVDLFGGEEDIKNGIIKTVGTPEERFNEDALRILRAFRFASQLNYKIDEETENAAISLADTLCKLSGERVLSEIKKLAVGKNPFIISTLLDRGALLPFGIGNFRLMPKTFLDVEAEFRPVIFIFLCEHDNALIKENLKPDNKLLKQLEVLEEFFEIPCPRNKTDLKKIYSRYPDQIALYLNFVKLCFPLNYLEIRNLTYEILEESEPYLIAHLAIDGNEIKKLGITSAKIGETLISLLAKVIADPSLNTKEQLLNIISNKNK